MTVAPPERGLRRRPISDAAAVMPLGSPANGNVTGGYLPVAGGID